jgi:hypothetical protein
MQISPRHLPFAELEVNGGQYENVATLTINSAGDCHVFEFLLVLFIRDIEVVACEFLPIFRVAAKPRACSLTSRDTGIFAKYALYSLSGGK